MFLNSFSFLATIMLSTHAQLNEIDAYSRSLESQVKKFEKTFVATRTTSITKD
jgi:hypothetical protein